MQKNEYSDAPAKKVTTYDNSETSSKYAANEYSDSPAKTNKRTVSNDSDPA